MRHLICRIPLDAWWVGMWTARKMPLGLVGPLNDLYQLFANINKAKALVSGRGRLDEYHYVHVLRLA